MHCGAPKPSLVSCIAGSTGSPASAHHGLFHFGQFPGDERTGKGEDKWGREGCKGGEERAFSFVFIYEIEAGDCLFTVSNFSVHFPWDTVSSLA